MEKDPQENDICLESDDHRKFHPFQRRLNSIGVPLKVLAVFGCLLFFLIVLLVVIIVLAVTPCSTPEKPLRTVCKNPDCLRAAASVLEKLNTSADPCVDFYNFACGSWLRGQQISPQFGKVSIMGNARLVFSRRSREIIETLPHTSDFRSLHWKIKSFYHSCMDLDSIDSAGDASFKRHIEQLKGWKPIGTWLMNSWDWGKVLRDLHSAYGVFPFFRIAVVPDEINPIQNVIQIEPSGLGLPHYSYYFRSPDDQVVSAYQQLMKDLAQLLGATLERSIAFADEVYHFEKRIAENILNQFDTSTAEVGKAKITVKELRQLSQRINWINHLKAFFPQAYISESTPIYTLSKHYLIDISTILSTTDMGSLNSYLIWTLVSHYAPSLSKSYRSAIDRYRRVYTGATQPQDRWEYCIEATNKVFSLALTSLYVQADIPEESFNLASDLFRSVRSSFIDNLQDVGWMDSTTKKLAIEKIKNISPRIAQQEFIIDHNTLDTYYDMFSVLKTDFFQNVQSGAIFQRSQLEAAIRTTSREYLEIDTLFSEGTYHKDLNQILLSPVLLQKSLFDLAYPRYLLLGSLGFYIGHGLVQGLEEIGYTYGAVGNKPVFWDTVTSVEYDKHRMCVAAQYTKKFEVNGNLTVINNVADIGGLVQAYHAFTERERKDGLEPLLPVLSFAPEQLFFIAYAQTLCSESRQQQLENDLHLSKYLSGQYRVTGALSQVPTFADVFGCSKGAALNPDSRCSLW